MQFPGGEWHLKLRDTEPGGSALTVGTHEAEPHTTAYARLTGCTADDLVLLGLWADAAHQAGQRAIALIPYLPAARADRGTPFGAKVYANLINAAGCDEVVIFDPHSPVAPALIERVRIVDAAPVLASALERAGVQGDYAAVLAPDNGAASRAAKAAEALSLPLYQASKQRDFASGKLQAAKVPELPREGKILVVDDICDGGGTFIGLAEAARIERERLALWVSHGIFSGQADRLTTHYADIWTTDSHTGSRRSEIGAHITELLPHLLSERTQP